MSSPTTLLVGSYGILDGLQSKPELNGTLAKILEFLPNGRVQVQCRSQVFSVQPKNLLPRQSPSVSADPSAPPDLEGMSLQHEAATTKLEFLPTSTASFWSKFSLFYPYGNTPAKRLTKYVPNELGHLNALLLGCGDPRHLLYTCSLLSPSQPLVLDVTMCDINPSIIARNLILFKCILEGISENIVWCLFYSRYIDSLCMSALQTCATQLLSLSDTLDVWHATTIGRCVRFCDAGTLASVRSILELYSRGSLDATTTKRKETELTVWRKKITQADKIVSLDGCIRHHPCVPCFVKDAKAHTSILQQYHESGVAPDCIYKPVRDSRLLNPMILSGASQDNTIHYTLEPTMGYHKALLYVDMVDESRPPQPLTVDQIYLFCFHQFKNGLSAFAERAKKSLVIVRLFCGDALSFAEMLANPKRSSVTYVPHHSLAAINILEDVPRVFELIDTSNLSDALGLVNVILACLGVLDKDNGVIMTDMLSTGGPSSLGDFLLQELRTDLNTFSMLTGLTLIGPNIEANAVATVEAITAAAFKTPKMQRILEWRHALGSNQDPGIAFPEAGFINAMFRIYVRMFEPTQGGSGLESMLQMANKAISHAKDRTQNSFALPSLLTFVKLASLARSRFRDDSSASGLFYDLFNYIQNRSGFMLQSNVSHLFLSLLVKAGLVPLSTAKADFDGIERRSGYRCDPSMKRKLFGPVEPTLIVRITFLVPMNVIKDIPDEGGTVAFDFSLNGGDSAFGFSDFDNRFQCTHIGYAKERILLNTGASTPATLPSNALVLKSFALIPGTQADCKFMVFTLHVPRLNFLVKSPDTCQITLHPKLLLTIPTMVKKYGYSMKIFGAKLSDASLVSVSNYEDFAGSSQYFSALKCHGKESLLSSIAQFSEEGFLSEYKFDVSFNESVDNFPKGTQPVFESRHPHIVNLSLGSKQVDLHCPSLVDKLNLKIQIVRQEQLCKVTLRSCDPSVAQVNKFTPFLPLIHRNQGTPNSSDAITTTFQFYDLPYVQLDSLPKIDFLNERSDFEWLFTLAGCQLSMTERKQDFSKPISAYKSTIHAILLHMIGRSHTPESRPLWYMLEAPSMPDKIAVYVNALCIDVSVGSVVIDAAVALMTEKNAPLLHALLMKHRVANDNTPMLKVNITDEEHCLWLDSFPVLCERARLAWHHRLDCQYVTPEWKALSREQPVCSCALGANSLRGSVFLEKHGRETEAMNHFFRVAISPLFPKAKNEESVTVVDSCAKCNKRASEKVSLQACGRCRAVKYCSSECQKLHWKEKHREECQKT